LALLARSSISLSARATASSSKAGGFGIVCFFLFLLCVDDVVVVVVCVIWDKNNVASSSPVPKRQYVRDTMCSVESIFLFRTVLESNYEQHVLSCDAATTSRLTEGSVHNRIRAACWNQVCVQFSGKQLGTNNFRFGWNPTSSSAVLDDPTTTRLVQSSGIVVL